MITICIVCIAMLCACSSSDNNNSGTNYAVTAVGGTGSNGSGGSGGGFYVESDAAIKVLKSGSADASFTMPDTSTYDFGSNGYTVSTNEYIYLDTAVPAGYTGLYVMDNSFHGTSDFNLYKANGGTAGNPNLDYQVTGLRVPSGATLTISADSGHYSSDYFGTYIELQNDVVIDGTLQTAAGYNYIYFDNSSSYSNNIVVTGTVTTSGADAGWIEFEAGKHFYNSGTLDASGGDNTTGDGYNSYGISLYAYTGSVYSKGTIRANGGNGGNGNGGDAAHYIELIGGDEEDTDVDSINGGGVILSGTVEARGGNAGGTTGGNGGNGGGYYYMGGVIAMGGDTIVNASFNFSGGNASGAGYTGGAALGLPFFCIGEDYRRVGVCQISGSFNLNGGNGEIGGDAGYVEILSWSWIRFTDQPSNILGQAPDVELLGFANINLNGGNGTSAGGNAYKDTYELYTLAARNYVYDAYLPAYPIVSEANVSARGGDASASGGTGGTGGYVELATDADDDYSTTNTTVTQSGTINISGGNATASGGIGGNSNEIYLGSDNTGYCWNVTTTGTLTANGGNGALQGGNGGLIDLYSDETVTAYTLANLSINGGTGTTAGSPGSAVVDGNPVLP